MEEFDLPDGMYILPVDLAVRCKQLQQRAHGYTRGIIRCSIVAGSLCTFKTADSFSYYTTREGKVKAEGHTFITNEVELSSVGNALPYAYRS